MRRLLLASTAVSLSLGWTPVAQAQTPDLEAVMAELARLRAEVSDLNRQVDTLEAELDVLRSGAPAAPAPPPPAAAAAEPDTTISWHGAPEIEGKGGWSFKPRGRLQYDAGFVSAPDGTSIDPGFETELRRARLGVEGDIPGGFGYKFEIDFAGNEVELTDAILTYKDGGLTVSIGQHNPFQSMEELTSSRFSSFMERAAFTDAFGFERRVGASLQYGGQDYLIQAGLFSDNVDDLPGDNWSADGRMVYFPRIGGTQLHLGGSVHYTEMPSGTPLRYRQRPFVHFSGSRPVDTASFAAESEFGVGAEFAAISGPFHAAAEAFWQNADRPGMLEDAGFFGGYAEIGYFLTGGDTRGYKKGVFDRVKPANPVGEGGFGAVQLNLRFDRLDLNDSDAGILGGSQDAYGVSLVWTPTDYTRFILNYAHLAYSDAVLPATGGDTSYGVDSFGVRAQVDF